MEGLFLWSHISLSSWPLAARAIREFFCLLLSLLLGSHSRVTYRKITVILIEWIAGKKRDRCPVWSVQLCFTFSHLWCAVNLMSENRPDRLWLDVRHVPPIGVGPCAVPWETCTGLGGRIHGHSNIQPFNSHPHPSHPRKTVLFHSVYAQWIDPRKYWARNSRRWKMTSNTLCSVVSISVTHVWQKEREG